MAGVFSIVGLFAALAMLVILIFKGWHMAVAAFLAAMVVILTSGMDVWDNVSVTFAGGFQKFAGTWFLMFTLGAIFGKVMEESGASSSIANSVVQFVGRNHVVPVVLITTMILAYGGIGTFIIAFTMYPICLALFKEGNVPKRLFPGLLLAQPATTCMVVLPGTTAISNMLPTQVFGTTIYAAPMMGILTSVFIFALHYVFFTWVVRRCWERGDNFIPGIHDVIVDFTSADTVAKLPSPLHSFLPIVSLVGSILVFQLTLNVSNYAVVLGIALAITAGLVLFRGRLSA
ncbi:MAG: GntP family permease, partial [Planctomycetota bacterium]|nr:GntP family permease [Planctomycetota bacterium]